MERTKWVVDGIIESENGYQFTNDKYYLENRTGIVPEEQNVVPWSPENIDGWQVAAGA